MKKKNFYSVIFLSILVFSFVFYFFWHFPEFKSISFQNISCLLPAILLILSMLYTNGLVIKYLLEPFKIKLFFREWLGLSVITAAGNYLTPFRGGAIARATYLKHEHKFSHSHFLSTLAGIYVIVFWVNSLAGITTLGALYLLENKFNFLLFSAFLILFLGLSLVILLSPRIRKTKLTIINKIIMVINGWNLIKKNKKIIFAVALIALINILIMAGIVFFEFKIIGKTLNFIGTLFIAINSTLSLFLSITPGSLGVKEAIIVFSARILGISPAEALTVGVIDRLINLALLIILSPIFSYFLIKKKTTNVENR